MNDAEKTDWLARVKADGFCLATAPAHIRADEDVVFAAVCQSPGALQFASEEVRDSAVVAVAVSEDGMTLKYALGAALHDRAICREAVWQNGMALDYVPEEVRADADIVLTAVRNCPNAALFVDEATYSIGDLAERIAECHYESLWFMPPDVACRPSVVAAAERSKARIAKRRLEGDAFNELVSLGLERGELLYQDICSAVPEYALSEHEISEIADKLTYQRHIAVYPSVPTQQQREANIAFQRGQMFSELFADPIL